LVEVGLCGIVVGAVGENVLLRGVTVEVDKQVKAFAILFLESQPEFLQCGYFRVGDLVLAVEVSVEVDA
jgi:hypothetical protein